MVNEAELAARLVGFTERGGMVAAMAFGPPMGAPRAEVVSSMLRTLVVARTYSVPSKELAAGVFRTEETAGALGIVFGDRAPGGAEFGESGVQGAQPRVEVFRSNENLPVIDVPLIASKGGVACFVVARSRGPVGSVVSKHGARLEGAKSVTLFGSTVVLELLPTRKDCDRLSSVVPVGPCFDLAEFIVDRGAYSGPFTVAEHVNEVEVSSNEGWQFPVDYEILDSSAPVAHGFTCSGDANPPLVLGSEVLSDQANVFPGDAFGIR